MQATRKKKKQQPWLRHNWYLQEAFEFKSLLSVRENTFKKIRLKINEDNQVRKDLN